ncbi:glycosyltransferase family 9 protein [bacterium]|jgi:ADP-heptose:LPS heptosyltransferase|nr:glycosyltransferase family 9 protein [bacterium]
MKDNNLQASPKIAIFFPEYLGDYHFLVPFIHALKECYPTYNIHLYTTNVVKVMAEKSPVIDEVYDCTPLKEHGKISWKASFSFLKLVKHRKYDVAYFTNVEYFYICFFAGIKTIIKSQENVLFQLFCKGASKKSGIDNTRHSVERHIANLECIFNKKISASSLDLDLKIPDSFLKYPTWFKSSSYVVICPDAHSCKNFDRQFYILLINELITKYEKTVVIVGLKDPFDLRSQYTEHHKVIDAVGRTSIFELMGLIKSCDCFFGVDSGPAHIAASYSRSGIIFYPPKGGHPYLTHSFSPQLIEYKMPQSDSNCDRFCANYSDCAYLDCEQDYDFVKIKALLNQVVGSKKLRTWKEKKCSVFTCEFNSLFLSKKYGDDAQSVMKSKLKLWNISGQRFLLKSGLGTIFELLKVIRENRIKVIFINRNYFFYRILLVIQWFFKVTDRGQFVIVDNGHVFLDKSLFLSACYSELSGKVLEEEYD